jgi:hypothetical protein
MTYPIHTQERKIMYECENCGAFTMAIVQCHECGYCICSECFDKTYTESTCLLCESMTWEPELILQ